MQFFQQIETSLCQKKKYFNLVLGEANKQIADYRYKLQKAEQEIASLQASLARSETQVIRYKSTADAAEKAESELKLERRKLQREVCSVIKPSFFIQIFLKFIFDNFNFLILFQFFFLLGNTKLCSLLLYIFGMNAIFNESFIFLNFYFETIIPGCTL